MKYELERMIDKYGLSKVLYVIVDILYEKSDHIEHSWQDYSLAKQWTRVALKISNLAGKLPRVPGIRR